MRVLLIFLVFVPLVMKAQFYNGSNQTFGKNRVQYYEFDWRSQNYERFKLYFYRGADDYADYIAKTVQKELLVVEEKLNIALTDQLEFLLFKSLGDLRQSNIGLTNENLSSYGGKSQIIGSKLLLYYEQDHIRLNEQIREVITEAAIRRLLYGNQWADILIGSDPNKHPDWFIKGLVGHFANEWTADFESKVKDGFLTGKFENFSLLNSEESEIAGKAFWNYINETYGKSQLMSLLFVTRNVGHIDRALEYMLGSNLNELLPEFNNYYKKRFMSDLKWQEDLVGVEENIKIKKNRRLTTFAVSPDGEKMAYVLNQDGRYKLYLRNYTTEKTIKLVSNEPRLLRIQDEGFPVMTFHPNSGYLVYFLERKGQLLFHLYDIEDGSTITKEVPSLEKILSCDYSKDGKAIAISGVKNGQTDLYLYSIPGNSLDQLTDDLWDDLDPSWSRDGEGLYFSSNRSDLVPPKKQEILPIETSYDLFLFPLRLKNKKKLKYERITETPDVNERQSAVLKNGNLSYLSDYNGIWNRWELKKDSVISFIDTLIHYRPENQTFAVTNSNIGILKQALVAETNEVYSLVFQNNRYSLLKGELNHEPKETEVVYFKDRLFKKQSRYFSGLPNEEKPSPVLPKKDSIHIEVSEDGLYEQQKVVLYQNEDEKRMDNLNSDTLIFERDVPKKYKLNFAKDYLTAKMDNAFLNQSYQVYSGPGSVFLNPSVSGMVSVSFSDVMEDIVFAGGMRIPTSKNNSEFYAGIDFRKKRLDKQVFYYRRSYENNYENNREKIITHELQLNLVYPFSEVFSWRGTVFSRTDIAHPLAYNAATLLLNKSFDFQGGAKTSLVFDNAIQWTENCWEGSRMKVFAEYIQSSSAKAIGMINLGFDARHSVQLRKELIWVNRLAAGTSFGGKRLLYYMGGVDNWMLRPKVDFNTDLAVDPAGKFAYQTLATPMRGFLQNQRNGNSFAVFNSELRVPLFLLFTKGAIKNEPLRSFQLIGFFDLGTAWNGPNPFSDENIFNELIVDNKPVLIKIENSREPIIAATGFGARTKLFGYFIRADLGWGIENLSFNKKPTLFLSLTHDI